MANKFTVLDGLLLGAGAAAGYAIVKGGVNGAKTAVKKIKDKKKEKAEKDSE